ncbi:uncharacterized protein LOC118749459 [Rhagoletis pomonella]|uniref:uncharacterized protein LOC118749459 n=1 Tax=Rhagoletis pomonella TaxID=28610 RepID=UPI00178282E5|nr:uncharacterized protein LOC118749459 [Rhagoletis pomonella]
MVQAVCSDTTGSNTGQRNGVFVLIEKQQGRTLLYLACRHHMAKIILKNVFEVSVNVSSGPEVSIFKRFPNQWPTIDQKKFLIGIAHKNIPPILREKSNKILQFVQQKLTEDHCRDDYKELLELVCIFLGGTPPRGIKFYKPGAIHEARFMSKAIYSLKIVMFKNQIKLTAKKEKGSTAVSVFVAVLYVKYWFTASDVISAPRNNFQFLLDLKLYEKTDNLISNTALKKFSGHLWYISQELTGLALLDDSLHLSVKSKMVKKISTKTSRSEPPSSRAMEGSGLQRIKVTSQHLNNWLKNDLSHFVTPNTIKLFERFVL